MQRFTFAYEGTEYSIPSPLFPLTSPDDISTFSSRGMSEITDEKMIEVINSLDFEVGKNYDNAEKLDVALLAAGFNSFFFSGWLFAGAFPIHHAWVMVVHNDEYHLIDPAYHRVTDAVLRRLRGRGNIQDEIGRCWGEELGKRKKNTDRIIAGIPTEIFLYVGNPDTVERAEAQYFELSKSINHPSYHSMEFAGDSELEISVKY